MRRIFLNLDQVTSNELGSKTLTQLRDIAKEIGIKSVSKYKKNELILTKTTNKEGIIIFDNLELGNYYIKEIETNNNYILDDKEYEISLKYKDEETSIIKEYIRRSIQYINDHQSRRSAAGAA